MYKWTIRGSIHAVLFWMWMLMQVVVQLKWMYDWMLDVSSFVVCIFIGKVNFAWSHHIFGFYLKFRNSRKVKFQIVWMIHKFAFYEKTFAFLSPALPGPVQGLTCFSRKPLINGYCIWNNSKVDSFLESNHRLERRQR